MGISQAEVEVAEFFERIKLAGLKLPDGWFGGRAMDSLLGLTLLVARPKRLIMELDDQLLLSFTGSRLRALRQVSYAAMLEGTPGLRIEGFDHCCVEWLSYGRDEPHQDSYWDGVVEFIAPA